MYGKQTSYAANFLNSSIALTPFYNGQYLKNSGSYAMLSNLTSKCMIKPLVDPVDPEHTKLINKDNWKDFCISIPNDFPVSKVIHITGARIKR